MIKILFCLLALGYVVVGKIIPADSKFKPCHRSDPEINKCLLNQADHLLQFLKNGHPQHKLPPFDPYKLDSFSVDADLENIKLKVAMSNLTIIGQSDTVFQKINFDPKTLSGDLLYTIPFMRFTCDYTATGRLFLLPLDGSANFDSNCTGMNVHSQFRLKTVKRKGKEYFKVDYLTWDFDLDVFNLNLVSVDPAQQPQMNILQEFSNENFALIQKTVNPIANENGAPLFAYVIDSFLRRIPAEEIIPY